MGGDDTPLLEVTGLTTRFHTEQGVVHAVEDVSFTVRAGERFGIVGESGSGKSVTVRSVLGLVESPGLVERGQIVFKGCDLRTLNERGYRKVRGGQMALVLQDPLTALNPVMRIGDQLTETIKVHRGLSGRAARGLAIQSLTDVGIPHAHERINDYAHEFSGGMRQRVSIALALSCDPDLLFADEPTTALDVTIQAQILDLLERLTRERGMAVVLITHDLAVIAGFAEQVAVMYAGRVVERSDTRSLFATPRHPYTQAMLESTSRLDRPPRRRHATIPGSPPNLLDPPSGCAYHPRCHVGEGHRECVVQLPALQAAGPGGHGRVACHFAAERRGGTA